MKTIAFLIMLVMVSFSGFSQVKATILKTDGTYINALIKKVSDKNIEYFLTSQSSGPLREISNSYIEKIIYSDGHIDSFNNSTENTTKARPLNNPELPNSSKLTRQEISIVLKDERENKYQVGKDPNGITWIPIKTNRNDKKDLVFPMFESLAKNKLYSEEFNVSKAKEPYTLEVDLLDLYYVASDKVTYLQFYQRCKIKYKLTSKDYSKVLFESEVFTESTNKRKELRNMPGKFGFLQVSILKNLNKFLADSEFKSLFQ